MEKLFKNVEKSDYLYHINNRASDLYFVIEGIVTIVDKNMNVINQNPKHSIIGFQEFAARYV